MGWLKRRWQDDEEAVARMQSRYAASEDGDPTTAKKSASKKTDEGNADKPKKDGDK